MLTRLGLFAVAACVALAAASATVSAVEFGSPSGFQTADGSTNQWPLLIESTATSSGWTGGMQYHAINTKGTGTSGRIVPSTNGHAINTKGTGAAGRYSFSPPSTGGGTIAVSALRMPTADSPVFQLLVSLSDGSGVEYSKFALQLDGTALNGARFSGAPTVAMDSDGFTLDYSVFAPPGATADTETASFQQSAVVVPEPTSAALAGAVALLIARRGGQRRTRHENH